MQRMVNIAINLMSCQTCLYSKGIKNTNTHIHTAHVHVQDNFNISHFKPKGLFVIYSVIFSRNCKPLEMAYKYMY